MIECTKFTSYQKNHLLGFADLYVDKWGVEIRGCKLFGKDGKRWLSLPDKEYKKPDGETGYSPIVYFKDVESLKRFGDEGKKAIDKYCQDNAKTESEQGQSDTEELPFWH